MKHIKLYEEVFKYKAPPMPSIGDYVLILNNNTYYSGTAADYIQSHVGQVIKDYPNIVVDYDIDNKSHLPRIVINLKPEEVEYWSSNRDELEAILQANKYNL